MGRIKDLTGKRFGRLTAMEHVGFSTTHNALWRCVCDCGHEKVIRSASLLDGSSQSCGCLRLELSSQVEVNEIIEEGITAKIVIVKPDGTTLYAIIDNDDVERIRNFGRRWYEKTDSKNGCQYVYANLPNRKMISLHRFITNCPRDKVVDHLNHNGLDNRRCNLKIVTVSQNKQNLIGAQRNNLSSGIRGVSWHKASNKWRARIKLNGKLMELGTFTDINEAERTVIDARQKYFSNLNPIFK